MVAARRDSSTSATLTPDMSALAQTAPHSSAPAREFDDATPTTFHFDGYVDGVAYPSLSPAQQDAFKADFFREVTSLEAWCRQVNWLPNSRPKLQVFVSDDYKISKSLVPAALDRRGRMEFPAWKTIAGEAAIAHELVHVYFPNGNRFLAEGLAVYLQAKIGGNPAFPNFGKSLHEMTRELLGEMIAEPVVENSAGLEKLRLVDLDKIATPSPLRLRVGRDLYDNNPTGQAHIYPIVGSFVQFLIDSSGCDTFRTLFAMTPLVPFERDAGSPDRWLEVYGLSLPDLERPWKSLIASYSSSSSACPSAAIDRSLMAGRCSATVVRQR
jgi:hypothetical protein